LVGSFIIVLGLFVAFFGSIFSNIVVFLVGALAVTAILLIVLYSFILGPKVDKWLAWLIVSLSILVGLITGFILTKTERFYSVVMSAFAGYITGALIDIAVLYLIGSKIVFWSVNLGLAALCAVAALRWHDVALILSTSLIGSFLTARGIALFAGGWTNEQNLIAQMLSSGVESTQPWFYAYLSGILVLTTISSVIQLSRLNKIKERQKPPYNRLN